MTSTDRIEKSILLRAPRSRVWRALTDPTLRNQTIDVTGPANLTMEQLARHLGASKVRHIPRSALRFSATLLPPFAPAFARQARAALVMDTTDMTFENGDGHVPLTTRPSTSARTALARTLTETRPHR